MQALRWHFGVRSVEIQRLMHASQVAVSYATYQCESSGVVPWYRRQNREAAIEKAREVLTQHEEG